MQKNVFRQCKSLKIILKKLFVIGTLCFFSQGVFAGTGSLLGKNNLRVSKTQWFDIIYPPESQTVAAILFEKADEIYAEVTSLYDLTPAFRMPLVITPGTDNLNAFWTAAPYNHIVIYDTSINEVGELSTYSETLLSVFRHELTHAVTNNMKNGYWQVFTKIFGDPVVPGMLTVTSGIAEGATLTSESAAGEGRLNDEYSKHLVKQAKLEGTFPNFYDVQGASDKYPGGTTYFFNGAFHQWLQDNYGMQSYADFWYNLVNINHVFLNSNFKSAFGINIKDAWKQFMADYEVPDIAANPITTDIQDFFVPSSAKYSKLNNSGNRYFSLTASDDTLYWIDGVSNKIQYVSFDIFNDDKIRPKTLFTVSGIEKISVSKDNRFLAISYYSGNAAGSSARTKIYDLMNHRMFEVQETGYKNAAIIQADEEYYLVVNKYVSPNNNLIVSHLVCDDKTGRIVELETVRNDVQSLNVYNFDFVQSGNGQFAFIRKSGLNYSIVIENIDGSLSVEYGASKDRFVIGSLSAAGNDGTLESDVLYFSWTEPGSMPRLGALDLRAQTIRVSDRDLSGGVYEPVRCGNQLVYSGHFFRENRLFRAVDFTDSGEYTELITDVTSGHDVEIAGTSSDIPLLLDYEPYNPFKFLTRGIFVPASIYETEYFGCNSKYISDVSMYLLGATYISANPWTDGNNDLFILTGGWNYLNNSFGIDLTVLLGTDTPLLSSTIDIKNEFDDSGWKMTSGEYSVSSSIDFGNISYLLFRNDLAIRIGRQDRRLKQLTISDEFRFFDQNYFKCCSPKDNTIYSSVSERFTIGYSNAHKAGSMRYSKAGLTATLGFEYKKDQSLGSNPVTYTSGFNVYPAVKAYLPWLFPTQINLDILPAASLFGYTKNISKAGRSIIDVKTESVLFVQEVQKALPVVHQLFLNDVNITAGYAYTLGSAEMNWVGCQMAYLGDYLDGAFKGNACHMDSIYLKANVEFTPNIGMLANSSYKMTFYSMFVYSLRACEPMKNPFSIYMGLQTNF